VTPAQPVCRKCHRIADVTVANNEAVTRCSQCGEEARYQMPAHPYSDEMRGVIAPRHRSNQAPVKIEESAGLVALSCPQCGGNVKPVEGDTMQCAYCEAVLFLPPRVRMKTGGKLARAPRFWVAFAGPSRKRRELEDGPALVSRPQDKPGLLKRGVTPFPGIELAPVKPGLDVRQLALTSVMTLVSLGIGAAVVFLLSRIH
jgi:hypothetical protein